MDNKIIKFVLHIEKIIGVFRNFCNYSKNFKTFVLLTICVEAATHTVLLGNSKLYTEIPQYIYLLHVMHAVFTVTLSASACYYSKHFMSLLNLLSQIDGKLKCNSNDIRSSYSIFIIILFLLVFCIVHSMNHYWWDLVWYEELILVLRELFFLRFMTQSVLLINMLYVLRNQLEWITRGCTRNDDDELFYKRGSPSVVELKMEPPTPYALDDCVDAYRNIRAATQQINKIFSLQILMIIISKCAYYILCLYKMTYDIVKSDYDWVTMGIVSLRVMLYLLALLGLCWSAQSVMKSVNTLQRTLGRNMINFVLSDKRSFQETRNFSRGITRNPVKIQVYGFIDVDMTLLPKLAMVIVSYTVLVLQYNNII